ncbi:MAG TPA: hypothetical protein VGV61_00825 [Thermoanaerobaculia bacterium]|jgi:hypothetical protein|nr:hypothetical protein [Thermoanaerobaculia bacterium]
MLPALSTIVVVGRLRARAAPCLASLLTQRLDDASQGARLEVLLVDCGGEGLPPVAGSDDPRVVVLRQPPGTTYARSRADAVSVARASVVAFVEEHVRVRAGWAAALLRAHAGPFAGVGAVPLAGNPEQPRTALLHLASYGDWAPPVARGEVALLPGHNASFKTAVLRGYGDELEELLQCDLVLHGRLRRDGHRLAMEPDAVIEHLAEPSVRCLLRGLFWWYRCYAPLRAEAERWSPLRRGLYVVGAPLVPLYALRRFWRRLRHQGLAAPARVLRWAPAMLALAAAGAAGQTLGLLAGAGDALVRFTDYELHAPRPEAPESAAAWSGASTLPAPVAL